MEVSENIVFVIIQYYEHEKRITNTVPVFGSWFLVLSS
jgi:hypothetical protein